jgi:exosortase
VLFGLLLALGWAYWVTLGRLVGVWARDPQYSHGFLVPVFALVLLWLRRDRLAGGSCRLSWLGLPLLGLAGVLRLAGAHYFFGWLDALSLLVCLAGVAAMMGGWLALRWAWPAVAFLVFMIPLPYQLRTGIGAPLQQAATTGSVYVLQTLGRPALAEGNVIVVGDLRVGVVEACDGLSMRVIFFAVSTAVAGLVQRPWWERALIVLSALPVGLVSNLVRVTATALLYELGGKELGDAIFHDWSGWLMMPLAICLLWAELALVSLLLAPEEAAGPVPVY